MDDGQIPSGWFWAALAGAALLGRALEFPIAWIAGYFGWRKAKDTEKVAALTTQIQTIVSETVDQDMSEIRQHVADVQKGIDGKQGYMESRVSEFYKEMVVRDERLTESLHKRMTHELQRHEERMAWQLDQLQKHLSDLVHTALNGRPPRR